MMKYILNVLQLLALMILICFLILFVSGIYAAMPVLIDLHIVQSTALWRVEMQRFTS